MESVDYSAACCIANCSSKDHTLRVDRNPCNVTLTVSQRMKGPVYMYYQLTNFYQNHRRYVKSRSDSQLAALSTKTSTLKDDCAQQLYLKGSDGKDNTSAIINPCGLVAWSLFNDSFELLNSSGSRVEGVSETGIAWSTDVNQKFRHAPIRQLVMSEGTSTPEARIPVTSVCAKPMAVIQLIHPPLCIGTRRMGHLAATMLALLTSVQGVATSCQLRHKDRIAWQPTFLRQAGATRALAFAPRMSTS